MTKRYEVKRYDSLFPIFYLVAPILWVLGAFILCGLGGIFKIIGVILISIFIFKVILICETG